MPALSGHSQSVPSHSYGSCDGQHDSLSVYLHASTLFGFKTQCVILISLNKFHEERVPHRRLLIESSNFGTKTIDNINEN